MQIHNIMILIFITCAVIKGVTKCMHRTAPYRTR